MLAVLPTYTNPPFEPYTSVLSECLLNIVIVSDSTFLFWQHIPPLCEKNIPQIPFKTPTSHLKTMPSWFDNPTMGWLEVKIQENLFSLLGDSSYLIRSLLCSCNGFNAFNYFLNPQSF